MFPDIIGIRVEEKPHDTFGPVIHIETHNNVLPNITDFTFIRQGPIYYAERQGWCMFFSYSKPGNGYGGSHIPIKMADGTDKTLIGPWSSRAGVINKLGLGPCAQVLVDNFVTHMTVRRLNTLLAPIGWKLVEDTILDEPYWVATKLGS